VTFVMEFLRSFSFFPSANLAAMKANGYPVALDANAELLESLAFTSMIQYSLESSGRY
jgi:hypothetical protein